MKTSVTKPTGAPGVTHNVGCDRFVDKATGETVDDEHVSLYGHPCVLRRIAARTTTPGAYPADGAGTFQSGGTTTVRLAADLPTTDIEFAGLVIVPLDGPAKGEWRLVGSVDATTKDCVPTRAWAADAAPAAGNKYALLVNCFRFGEVRVQGAIGGDADAAPYASIRVVGYDYPVDGTARAPRPMVDVVLPMRNAGTQLHVDAIESTSGYYLLEGAVAGAKGGIGFKVLLTDAPNAGVTLCAGQA